MDSRIAAARQASDAVSALTDLLEALRAEDDAAPEVGDVYDAVVSAANVLPDVELRLAHALERAEWRERVCGPSDPRTLAAWVALGETADHESEFDLAGMAWERAGRFTLPEDAPVELKRTCSRALAGLGSRRLRQGRAGDAQALFQRDLDLNRGFRDPADPLLVKKLDSLGYAAERAGDLDTAGWARRTQIELATHLYGAADVRVQRARERLAGLAK